MHSFNWNTLDEEALNPLVGRKMFHGRNLTVARIRLRKGAVVPMHSHSNEQISMVESGALRFEMKGGTQVLQAGDILVIPANEPHKVDALEDSMAVDVFSPPREDWIRGEDAYLRKS